MKTNIILSFDDARYDNTKAFDTCLIPLNIPFTLNVTTGYVDGSLPRDLWPSPVPAMNIDDIIRFSKNNNCEIALHGDQHIGTKDDVFTSYKKMCSWLGREKGAFGFASPGCNQVFIDELPEYIAYERVGINKDTNTLLKRAARRISRIIPSPLLYQYSFFDSIITDANKNILYSATVFKETTVSQIKRIIHTSIIAGGSIILQFHSVGFDKKNDDVWAWSFDKFDDLCKYICVLRDKNEAQISTTMAFVNNYSSEAKNYSFHLSNRCQEGNNGFQ